MDRDEAAFRSKVLELVRAQQMVARLTSELAAMAGAETGTRPSGRNAFTLKDAAPIFDGLVGAGNVSGRRRK